MDENETKVELLKVIDHLRQSVVNGGINPTMPMKLEWDGAGDAKVSVHLSSPLKLVRLGELKVHPAKKAASR